MNLPSELKYLSDNKIVRETGEFKYVDVITSVVGEYGFPSDPTYSSLIEGLFPGGLYRHQIDALNLIDKGHNVVLATPTASGKSLCYQLPIAKHILESKGRANKPKAIVLHPTKALAQDQLRSWGKINCPGLFVSTFDGDSSSSERAATKKLANVWLTNPEMLNVAIMAHHHQFSSLLESLKFIVLDEAHVYRGVFGSHIALLMRRLIRVAKIYGSDPQFIFTSATIADPSEICSKLINQPVIGIEEDTSPKPTKTLAIFEPKMINKADGIRASYSTAAAAISAYLCSNDHKVIAFVRSRRLSEVVAKAARKMLNSSSNDYRVLSYRGGYLPEQRRQIELLVTTGETKLLVATSAMELGVDLAILDASVIAGFPGTFSSFKQQMGRVGRSEIPSITILVCGPDALDQWVSANPTSLQTRPAEKAIINPMNPYILRAHLKAACYESGLSVEEISSFAPTEEVGAVMEQIDFLISRGDIAMRHGKFATNLPGPPHGSIKLRSSSGNQILISSPEGELIGTIEFERAYSTVHEGAIYLHLGQSFIVTKLDLEKNIAIVEPYSGSEQTRAIFDTFYDNHGSQQVNAANGISLNIGETTITETVNGFQILTEKGEALSIQRLDPVTSKLETRAFWFDFTGNSLCEIPINQLPGALHAAEHAMISMMPIFAICDRSDIGGVSKLHYPNPHDEQLSDLVVASITIYDGHPGGIGIAELGYDKAISIAKATLDMVRSCACEAGCPSCIQSPKCGNLNSPLNKKGAIQLLGSLLEQFAAN